MNTEAMHFLISFIKEYLGIRLLEIKDINDFGDGELTVNYSIKGMPEGTFQSMTINFNIPNLD